MAPQPQTRPLIAADSNVPLDLADGNESVRDAHLREIDPVRLTWELNAADVSVPVIATPKEIVRKFFH